MLKRITLACALLMLLASAALAQEEDKPKVLFLAFQANVATDVIQLGLLDTLQSYGYISPEDRPTAFTLAPVELAERGALYFKRLHVDGDLNALRGMMANALDQAPDALVTVTAPVTIAALQATADMTDPPAIFFADVNNPYEAGIADAPCLKPAHATGFETLLDYETVVGLLHLQDPNIKTIGVMHNSGEAGGVYGAEQITAYAEALGLTVEQTAVTSLGDLTLAAEGLVSKGVEAFVLPVDYTMIAGVPIINSVAHDNRIPVFHSSFDGVMYGAAFGAGVFDFYQQGDAVGLMIAEYLQGNLDIASASISAATSHYAIIVNSIVVEAQGYTVSEAMMERAEVLIVGTEYGSMAERRTPAMVDDMQRFPVPLAEREAQDREFLASIECTPELIAAQQAELDAMEG